MSAPQNTRTEPRSYGVRIFVSWLVVSIPIVYALYQTGLQIGPLLGIGG